MFVGIFRVGELNLRSPRGERIDLGQPITAVRPDGVSPGRVGFRVFKSARRIVLRIALDAEGTHDVFVCQQKLQVPSKLKVFL